MAKKTITTLDATPKYFVGQSMILIFDKVTDYSVATLKSILDGTPKWIGNVEADSTTPSSDPGTPTEFSNEQGQVVISTPGTTSTSIAFTLMSTSQAAASTFLGGTVLDASSNATDVDTITGVAVGYNVKSGYSMECPVAVVSKDGTQTMLFPRAQVVSTVSGAPGLSGYLNIAVTATALDTGNPKLGSIIFTTGDPITLG